MHQRARRALLVAVYLGFVLSLLFLLAANLIQQTGTLFGHSLLMAIGLALYGVELGWVIRLAWFLRQVLRYFKLTGEPVSDVDATGMERKEQVLPSSLVGSTSTRARSFVSVGILAVVLGVLAGLWGVLISNAAGVVLGSAGTVLGVLSLRSTRG